MNLKDYIALTGKSLTVVAGELSVSVAALSRWQNGKAIPEPEQMQKIMAWSKGNVMPNDFYPVAAK